MGLFVSTAWTELKGDSLERIIEAMAQYGIRDIELSGGTRYYKNLEKDLISLKSRYNLNYIIHNYFPPPEVNFVLNIASDDEDNLMKSIEFIKHSIDLSQKLGSSIYTLHSGYAKKLNPTSEGYFSPELGKVNWNKAYNNFYKSLDEILNYARKRNVLIGIENLFPFSEKENYSLMCTMDELEDMLSRYRDEENLGILLDLGHLNVAANYMSFNKYDFLEQLINNYRDRIFEIHISENDGSRDEHRPIRIEGWQLKVIEQYNLYEKPIIIEGKNLSVNLFKKVSHILEKQG